MTNTFAEFRKYLLVTKGISDVTIQCYIASIKPAFRRIKSNHPTHEQIIDYITWMYDEKYSYSHIVNTSLALEWWTKFHKYPIKLGRPKKPRTIVKDVLSEAETTRLIAITKNIREKAIITILAYSGIRNKELCNLRVCDVNLGDNMIRILAGKGKRDRLIHISGDCSRVILEYLNQYQRTPEDYLFTTLARDNRYTGCALRKLTHLLAERADIRKRVYPHLLRHSLAVNLLRRGCNLVLIQRQLGHAYISSTEIYIASFPQRVQSQYHLFIPSFL